MRPLAQRTWPLAALGALASAAGCSACADPAGSGGGGGVASAGSGAATSSGTTSSGAGALGAGGGGGGCPDPTTELPPDLPAGWVRAPCVPVDCGIYLAPTPALARAPSPWTACGDGCLEFVPDWGDPKYRFYGALGGSDGTTRYIGYTRNLGLKPGFPLVAIGTELQIVRLPDNVVTFDALIPPEATGTCALQLRALSEGAATLESYVGTDVPGPNHHRLMFLPAGESVPHIVYEWTGFGAPLEADASEALFAASYGRKDLHWHGPEPSGTFPSAWTSPDGRYLNSLSVFGSTVFFSADRGPLYFEQHVWDPVEGVRTLISAPNGAEGGVCCARGDGQDLVWFQGSGVLDPVHNTYSQVDLMASPYATHAQEVHPRKLRSAHRDYLWAGPTGVVGGGYAAHLEFRLGLEDYRVTVTRISDGAYWVLPDRPGFSWSMPLYVDAEELAVVLAPGKDVFQSEGLLSGHQYTIVRFEIGKLGPPTGMGSGAGAAGAGGGN
ncbi:MAG: hypothetical protein HY908_06590 [Myxococcales bacterium]|nr:hypothetical protein [Myxococcales bacterium]